MSSSNVTVRYVCPKAHENRTISSALQRPYGLYKYSSCLSDDCVSGWLTGHE